MAVTVFPFENASVWGPAVVAVAIVLSNLLAWALNPRSWAHRHLLSRSGVPKMLFVSNRREGVSKATGPQSYWCFDLLDPHHLVESPLLNTAGLLVLHACVFLYWVAAVLVDVVVEYYGYGCTASWCWRRSGPYLEWMTFLTNWSLSILGISGLVAFINTARYARRQRAARKQQQQQQQGEVELGAHSQSLHQHTLQGSSDAAPAPTAAAGAAPTSGLPGGWVHVFNRGGVAATDALAGPAACRDQAATPHQQQKQGGGGAPVVQQQQQQQQRSSADGCSCCSSGSSSSSCDTVVVVGPDATNRRSRAHTEKWDWLSVTHCLLSEVATTAAFFVSFWFWVGLVAIAGEFFRANGGTLMAHAGNLVLALCVVLLTRLPLVSTHFQVLLWYASLYMVFMMAYGGGSGTWRYGLDVQKAKPAGALLLAPLVVFVFFCLWFLVARLREAFLGRRRRRQQQAGRRAKQHTAAATGAAAAVV